MEELIKTFYIDWKLIIAQFINFVIVVGVLWYYAVGPLTKKMTERTKAIEKGLADAKKVEENLARAEELKEEKLADARREAERIIEEAKKTVEQNRAETLAKTKAEAEKVVTEAKRQIAVEKEKMAADLKAEVRDLVMATTAKVLEEVITADKDKELIKKTVEKIKL